MKIYPLTTEQKRMWIEWKSNPAGKAYNTAFQFEIHGALDLKRFKKAVAQVRGYLDGYRQYFVEKAGEPFQVILNKKEAGLEVQKRKYPVQFPEIPNFKFLDLTASGQREADLRAKALEIHEQSIRQRFDLLRDYPLEGYRLIRFGQNQYLFSQVSHHILSDGFSGALSLKLLSLCHNRPWLTRAGMGIKTILSRNKDMGAYLDYVQSVYPDHKRQSDQAYWQSVLKNAAFHVDFGLPRRGDVSRGRRLRFSLPDEAVRGIAALGQEKSPVKGPVKKTPFIILAAAFNALLYRYTGQADLVLGYPANLRPRNKKFNFLSGFMANQVLLRTGISENSGFGPLVEGIAGQRQADRIHQQYPYAELIRDLRRDYPSFSPEKINITLGQTAFGTHDLEFKGLALKPTFLDYGEVMADLTLLYDHDKAAGTLELAFEYRASLFEEDFVKRMQGHFSTLILDGLRHPDKPLSQLDLLTPDEFHRQWHEWNRTEKAWPRIKPIHQCFEAQAEKTPEALAVIYGKAGETLCLTYAGLNARANQAARYIHEKNKGPGGFIGVYMERSLEMVTALYAVIKAGCAYVPLDPELPMDRIEFMAADAGMAILLTQDHLRHKLAGLENRLMILTLGRDSLAGFDPSNPDLPVAMAAPVYAIYTSGSTGRPKGVVNIQAGLFNRLMWMQDEYPIQAGDRVLQKTPFAFDVSVWEFFWPLLTGAVLVVAPPGLHRDPSGLMDCMDEFRVTTLHFVPSMLALFLETARQEPGRCLSLKRIFSSGEALAPAMAGKFFKAFPSAELHNLYGPTEASIDVSFRPCSPEDADLAVLPIGKPIANTRLHILDKNRAPVPAGLTGELYIGGTGLAKEYLNRPDLTQEKFIADPFGEGRLYQTGDLARYLPDGSIEYQGRIDFQVKIRGFRIELGEIESCILAHPKIKEAVAVLKTKGDHSYLSAYVTLVDEAPDPGGALLDSLDRHLEKKLPSYMVPARFVILDEMPLTLNGKVDRKGLMQQEDANAGRPTANGGISAADTGQGPVEQALLQAFCQVLDRQDLGITDDFFRFGGDSLLAVKVAAKLKQAGLSLRLEDFFAHPNVAGLAPFIQKAGQESSLTREQIAAIEIPADLLPAHGLDPEQIEQAYELSLNQSYMVRYYAGGVPGQGFYHFQQAYFLEDTRLNLPLMIRAGQLVIEEHPILRTSFVPDPDRPFQVVRNKVDSPVSVLSFQGDGSALEPFVDGLMKKNRETAPFDPSDPKALLYRLTLIPYSKTGLVLLTEFHHAIIDGWSNAEFMKGVFTFYTALKKGKNPVPRPPLSGYRDLVALEKSHWRSETGSRFWKNQFQAGFGAPRFPKLNLPNPAAFPMAAERIPGSTGLSLKTLAGDLQVPVKTLFLSAYLTLLASLEKKGNRLTIGIVTNRRSAEMSHPFETVGYLWNLMPFTMDPAEISPDNLWRVHQELQRHEAHGKYPLPLICKDLGIDREDLLFHATFNFIHFHNTGEIRKALYSGLNGLRLTQVKTFNRFHYPLNLLCSQSVLDDGFDVFMSYDDHYFDGSKARDLLDHYLSILDTLARTQKDAA